MAEIVIKLVNGELAGKTMQSINKDVTAAAAALKKAEIGTNEWVKANEKLDRAKQLQADMKAQIEATSKASGILKQQFGGILNQIPGFSQLSGAMSAAKQGVGGLTSGMGLLKGALAASGIGLFVIAVGALVGWFTKTEKGANMVSGAFKGMKAVLDTLMNRLWNIGDTLKQLFSNPLEFFKNLGKDIKQAATEGYDLVQVFDDIEDRQRELDVMAKQQENQVDQMLLQSKNVATSYKERIALLDQADKITRKSYNDQLNLSKEFLAAVEREVAAATKQGTMGDELADKLRDAKLKVLDLEGQQITIEEKIQNRRDQIVGKQEKAAEKQAADKEKAIVKEEKDHAALLAEKEQQERAYYDALKSLQDSQLAAMDEGREKDLASLQVHLERQLIELDKNAPFYAERMKATVDAARKQREDINKKWDATEETERKASAERQLAIEKQKQQDTMAALNGSLNVAGNFFGALAGMQEEGSKQAKDFAYAQAVIGANQGGINAYTSTAAIPFVGPVLAPIAAALAFGVGMASANKIKNQKVPSMNKGNRPKAETGGYLVGPRHSQGGIPIEAEGGEFIFSRAAVAGLGVDNLARMNNQFAAGGPVDPFTSGRSAAASSGATGGSQGLKIDNAELVAEVRALRAEVRAWPLKLKVYNVVSETVEGIKTINDIQNEANV